MMKNTDKGITLYVCCRFSESKGVPVLSVYNHQNNQVIKMLSVVTEFGQSAAFQLITNKDDNPYTVTVPLSMIDDGEEHIFLLRYLGYRLELYLDGVLVDEEWPMGSIGDHTFDLHVHEQSKGLILKTQLFERVLSAEEVISISGGIDKVDRRRKKLFSKTTETFQYWKPEGCNTNVGDCMPFFHDGRFHLFYLYDRHHHKSKHNFGAHQWAHISSTDLLHWEQHYIAVPITDQWEGSICTGSAFFNDGKYYAFYAVRMCDGTAAPLITAESSDCINFQKLNKHTYLEYPYDSKPARDPVVFKDEGTGLYHMLVTTEIVDYPVKGRGGCLAHLVSEDLVNWKQKEPFIVPGYTGQPECPDYFHWNGWYYLIFSNDGTARYRMSKEPYGPWIRPAVDTFDGPQLSVLKTAPFKDNRRIGAAFLRDLGYAGDLVFREIIQNEDGSLGTKLPVEMTPADGRRIECAIKNILGNSSGSLRNLHIESVEDLSIAIADEVIPQNFRLNLTMEPEEGTSFYGIGLRCSSNYSSGYELKLEPLRHKVSIRKTDSNTIEENENSSIYNVFGIDKQVDVEITVCNDIIDVSIGNKRTLISRIQKDTGDRLFFFVQNGTVTFKNVEITTI